MKKIAKILLGLAVVFVLGLALLLLWPGIQKVVITVTGTHLKFVFRPGEENRYRIKNEIQMKTELKNFPAAAFQRMPALSALKQMTISQDNLIRMKIKEVSPDGEVTMDLKYETARQSFQQGNMPPQQNLPSPLQGRTINMKMNSKGEVTDIEGLQGIPGGQGLDLKETFRYLNPQLPDKRVRIGESWTQEGEVPVEGGGAAMLMNIKTVYTFEGFEKVGSYDCARIGTMTEVKFSLKALAAFHGDGGGGGTGKGALYFAYHEGKVIKSSIDMDTKMNFLMDIPAQTLKPGLNITQKTRSSMEIL